LLDSTFGFVGFPLESDNGFDNFAALQVCDSPLPANAFNRLADNWPPLFASGQIAGRAWPKSNSR
jgi:hypothetical protein